MDNNKEKAKDKSNASFVRWQGRTIEELGKAVNLLLTLSLATIGFVLSKVLDKNFLFACCIAKFLVVFGSLGLLISVGLLLKLIYNRLQSFRTTAKIARMRERDDLKNIEDLRSDVKKMDRQTWNLFEKTILIFAVGQGLTILGLMVEVIKRI